MKCSGALTLRDRKTKSPSEMVSALNNAKPSSNSNLVTSHSIPSALQAVISNLKHRDRGLLKAPTCGRSFAQQWRQYLLHEQNSCTYLRDVLGSLAHSLKRTLLSSKALSPLIGPVQKDGAPVALTCIKSCHIRPPATPTHCQTAEGVLRSTMVMKYSRQAAHARTFLTSLPGNALDRLRTWLTTTSNEIASDTRTQRQRDAGLVTSSFRLPVTFFPKEVGL